MEDKFSLEEFMSMLTEEFSKQKLENLGCVIDNTGKLVVSNAETEDEYVLENDSVKSVTGLIKFLVENGFKIDEQTVKNFSENVNFGVFDGATLGGKNDDKGLETKSKLDKLVQEILKSTAFVEEKLQLFVGEKMSALEAIKEGKYVLSNEINKSFEFISKVNKDIKKVEEKLSNNSSLQDYKDKESILEKEGLKDKVDIEDVENDSKKKWYADYEKLKEEKSSLSEDELSARLESLKKRKQALGFSEMNFDDSAKQAGILKIKGQLGSVIKESIEKLESSKQLIQQLMKELSKGNGAQKGLSKRIGKWDTNINNLSKYLSKVSKMFQLDKAEEQLTKLKEESDKRSKDLESEFESLQGDRKDALKILKECKNIAWEKAPKLIESAQDYADDPTEENEKILVEKLKKMGGNDSLIKSIVSKLSEETKLDLSDKKEETSKLDSNESSKENDTDDSKWDERYQKYVEKMKKDKKTPKGKEKWIKEMKSMGFSEFTSFSDILNGMTSKMVTNFDAHQVKDSDFGIVWEDKFGSLWSDNPDESGEADLLWESKEGKEQPTESVTEESDETMSEDEMDDSLGMESDDENLGGDDDLDLDSESEEDDNIDSGDDSEDSLDIDDESDDLGFSEDDDLDLSLEDNSEDDLSLEDDDNDLDLDDEDTDDISLDDETEEKSENDNMALAIKTMKQMYDKLVEKL